MSDIITNATNADFEAARNAPTIISNQVDIDKLLRNGATLDTHTKMELLVKKQIQEELKTIKQEQREITKRKAEELKLAGFNKKSGFWPRASIHPRAYYRWERAVPGCWEDKTFMDEYLRDNPEADLRKYMKRIMNV